MRRRKTVSPTESYSLDVPEDVAVEIDGRVASLWRRNEGVLLQLSSYARQEGVQVRACVRLAERLERERLKDVEWLPPLGLDCPDTAAAKGTDEEELVWVHHYAVWNDLTVYATASWETGVAEAHAKWTLEGIGSLRRVRNRT